LVTAAIVNLTPFCGPSADFGSAYEMGYMRAFGRPIFAYSNDDRPFLDRVTAYCTGYERIRPTGVHEDRDGMAIEPFELHYNLMIVGGVIASDHAACRTVHLTHPIRALCRTSCSRARRPRAEGSSTSGPMLEWSLVDQNFPLPA
jgi:nucleoside 2-deoxyribosyltransferase